MTRIYLVLAIAPVAVTATLPGIATGAEVLSSRTYDGSGNNVDNTPLGAIQLAAPSSILQDGVSVRAIRPSGPQI